MAVILSSCQEQPSAFGVLSFVYGPLQAPTDAQVSQETALAQQITKGQAREIMQKYMPVPETSLQTHCASLTSIATKHKQLHMQVCTYCHLYACSMPAIQLAHLSHGKLLQLWHFLHMPVLVS